VKIPTRPLGATAALALAVAVGLAVSGPAAAVAECSPGQMAEAQLQFQSAQQLLTTQQWDQAISQMKSIVDFCPDYFPAYRGLGVAYTNTGQLDLAAQAYQDVIDVRGNDVEATDFASLAKVLTMQKQYKEARAEYMKAEKLEPDNCAVLINLGILHNASGYHTQAVETLEHGLEVCPQYQQNILPQLSDAAQKAYEQQKRIGNNEKATLYLRKFEQYSGESGGSTAYDQIKEAMKSRDYEKTIRLCNQLLEKEPAHTGALLTLARAQDAVGNKSASVAAYQRYLAEKPEDLSETAAMIIVMSEAGQCAKARSTAADAAQRFASKGQKELGKIQFAWGKALFCAEEYAAARDHFAQAAASGDPAWTGAARDGIKACDEYIVYEQQKAKQAAQQGG